MLARNSKNPEYEPNERKGLDFPKCVTVCKKPH